MDATKDNGRVGRLINHGKKSPNLTAQVEELDSIPHLCFFMSGDIHIGKELLYDYGD